MKRSRLLVLPWLLVIGICDLGCSGTETGNPPRATLTLSLESSDERFSIGEVGAGIKITAARIGVERLAFTECAGQTSTQVAEAVAVDLRDNEHVFEVPEQSLCAVELSLESRDIAWANVHPQSDTELAVGVAGRTTSGTPLFIEDTGRLHVVFRPSTFNVTPGSELVLALDVATALSFDEIEQLPLNNDGEKLITPQQNAPILENIRQRWAASWSLYAVDSDGAPKLIATGEDQ